MNITIRPLTPTERGFTYSQRLEIMEQAGCIGYLRADMGSSGKGFFSTWNDYRRDLKTQTFKTEFDSVINSLRFDAAYDGILKDRFAMSRYCYTHPDTSYGNNREYGIRVDTEQYAYFMRLNPNKGEYNLYCYCYEREWIDEILETV